MYIAGRTITKRELLFSVILLLLFIIGGILIGNTIHQNNVDKATQYISAVHINNDDASFQYNLKTNVGNALVHGYIYTCDPVGCYELGGNYTSVKRTKEVYTPHTRTVIHTDSQGNSYTTVETYYTWDLVRTWHDHAQYVNFCGVQFSYDKLPYDRLRYLDTVYKSTTVRYQYYGSQIEDNITIFTNLNENTINDAAIYYAALDAVLEDIQKETNLTIFIICWSILSLGATFGFTMLENNWLEDKASLDTTFSFTMLEDNKY